MARLFDKEELQIEIIEEKINKYIEEGILNLERQDMIEKWNYLSLVNLENESQKTKFLEMIQYIDQVVDDDVNKIGNILTLAYLITKEKLDLTKLDENSIFLLINYANSVDISKIKEKIIDLINSDILYNIRLKTLDIDIRVELLDYLMNNYNNVTDMNKFIQEHEYYDMLEIIRS